MFCKLVTINLNLNILGLKIVHLNCRSLYRKLDKLINYFKSCDIVCCSETWLTKKMSDKLIFFLDMKIFRLDRYSPNGTVKGGGVCTYVCKKLAVFAEMHINGTSSMCDYEISITVTKPGLKQLIISCLYKLQMGKKEKVCNFLKGLYTNLRREIWLLGGFNVDYMDRANESRTTFIDVF